MWNIKLFPRNFQGYNFHVTGKLKYLYFILLYTNKSTQWNWNKEILYLYLASPAELHNAMIIPRMKPFTLRFHLLLLSVVMATWLLHTVSHNSPFYKLQMTNGTCVTSQCCIKMHEQWWILQGNYSVDDHM